MQYPLAFLSLLIILCLWNLQLLTFKNLQLFISSSLFRDLSILLIFSKNQLLKSLAFFLLNYVFYFFIFVFKYLYDFLMWKFRSVVFYITFQLSIKCYKFPSKHFFTYISEMLNVFFWKDQI